MGQTTFQNVDQVQGLVQTFWSPLVDKELRVSNLWLNVLTANNKNVETLKGGDTLRLHYIKKPSSTIRSIGTDADTYETNVLESQYVDLQVNKRAVSAFEFDELGVLLSQLEQEDSEIRMALMDDLKTQINDHIKSLISPSTASPDNTIAGVTDFTLAAGLSVARTRASLAKWWATEPWILALSPQYTSDLLDELNVSDSNKMGDGISPLVEGTFVNKRMNFNIFEDNSLTGLTVANDGDEGYAFLPSAFRVAVGQPRFKISDQHVNKKFSYVMSVDVPVGAVQFDSKRVISIGA